MLSLRNWTLPPPTDHLLFLESLLCPAIEASTMFVHLNVFLQSDILTFTQISVAHLWHRFCFWVLVFPISLPSWRFCSYVVSHYHCEQCPNRTAYKECALATALEWHMSIMEGKTWCQYFYPSKKEHEHETSHVMAVQRAGRVGSNDCQEWP